MYYLNSLTTALDLTHVTDEAAADQFIAAANAFRMQKMGREKRPLQLCFIARLFHAEY